ncbi:MAG: 6-bladed beta-propeller [Gammaproteobacteria bacterium]|nr:6-bladed beta-propeller [Gammaproteobacteria bacterium]
MKTVVHITLMSALLLLSACAQAPKQIEAVFYPPPPETPRVQFLTSITMEADLGKQDSRLKAFLVGEEEEQEGKRLARPYGIAHVNGEIYIADKTIKKIIIIDLDKRAFDFIPDLKGGALQDPSGVFITPDGYKYVADANRGQIVVYNETNGFHRVYGAEGQFRPTSVVVHENRIYVCDIADSEIEVLDKDSGEVIEKIGGIGKGEGSFHRPTHLAIDAAGNLYVTDALNFRVQMFDKAGTFVKTIGYQGSHPGAFVRPKGLDIDRDGHLYVADAGFEIIQIFDVNSGEPLLPFGKYGPAPGSTYLPSGVHIDYDNVAYFSNYADPDFKVKYLIYVGNSLGNHKLNIYGFGEWIGPPLKGYTKPEPVKTGSEQETVPSLDDIPGPQDTGTADQPAPEAK